MTRYREGKGKHGGMTLLSGEFVRNVDTWREWAAIALPAIRIECVDTPARWTVDADGRRVSQWLESDAPGLGQWLGDVIGKYHGAWHLARDSLALIDGQRATGADQAAKRKAAAAKADVALLKAAGAILKNEPRIKTAALAAILADRGLGARSSIERKLPGLLRPKKSSEGR